MKTSGTRFAMMVGAILLTVLAGMAVVVQSQKSAEGLFQSGLVMKEGRGDLESAIKIFAKILADFPKERNVTAKAQLQIGLCYEKLGDTKAQEAYRKVTADFGDQPDAVKIAREHLAGLTAAAAPPSASPGGLTLRQLDYPDGPISPDGRWVALNDIETNLTLYETATKKKRVITHYADKDRYPFIDYNLMWAPSSRRIAYTLIESELDRSIHIINIDGTHDRTMLRSSRPNANPSFAGWTKDEGTIYLLTSSGVIPNNLSTLEGLNVKSGERRGIKTFSKGESIFSACLSPDDRFIAFHYVDRNAGPASSKIMLLALENGATSIVDEHPESGAPATWTADSRGLIFTSRRTGTNAIWMVPMADGKAAGEPRLIREFTNHVTVQGIVGGDLHLNESVNGSPDSYTAQVDLETGKTLKEPEPLEKNYRGITSNAIWSPDGGAVAYFYQSSHRPTQPPSGYDTLRIRNLRSGQTKDLRSPFKFISYGRQRWSSDGNSLILMGAIPGQEGKDIGGLFRLDLKSGEAVLIRELPWAPSSAWTADGKIVYRMDSPPSPKAADRVSRLLRLNIETQEEKELFKGESGDRVIDPNLSDNDHWLSFTVMKNGGARRYCVMPAQGGDARLVFSLEARGEEFIGPRLFWAPEGKGVLLPRTRRINDTLLPMELYYIPLAEKAEPRILELKIKSEGTDLKLCFNPDGKTIAYQGIGKSEEKSWVLENFLPPNKIEKR